MKNSFVLYTDYKKHIDLLSVEDKARLLDAIFDYAEGNEVELDGMALMAFSFIRSQMDKDNEKYREICEKRRNAGQKGGQAKQEKANLANATFAKQEVANVADNDNENDNENDINKPPISPKGEKKGRSKHFTKPTVEEVSAYCSERGNGISAEEFIDYYEMRGWCTGKNNTPMKDWKAAVRTWERSRGFKLIENNSNKPPDNRVKYDSDDFDTLVKYRDLGYMIDDDGYWIDADGKWVLKESS